MLAKRIIPCLDVKDGLVVKGIKFCKHKIVGNILPLVQRYLEEGADEIVFYDILASSQKKLLDKVWISKIAEKINIPFCVAGGIKSLKDVKNILSLGADKISINSPAIQNPTLISRIADRFGVQCVVVGIDSWFNKKLNIYEVYQYTGDIKSICNTHLETIEWVDKVQKLGAGEIVLNMMNQDGIKKGYDIPQLKEIKKNSHVPIIASGGAGLSNHFYEVFDQTNVDGALAASVFHDNSINIKELKHFLYNKGITIRLC
ncbi:imidazole glycerol phosphate synthase subunit [Buchnera aphidicola (Nipponaphis monzeni)]|uniref:Imidazole glycerol phosphate synthase subunit HisF n=1 Tax=Buchnera aphidicola (Nipponaphis monzeni) TaxID=2495405 RepID=A0A455T9W1_9GAMM|nr:imidazole glycerol phosphate synthase subunit HisF [Buchnera aphidicola]BBI01103.1 imidazole glycerol phosphate synthase subunit [Buchnera aphidicola (Nipponaphis monzeni)]